MRAFVLGLFGILSALSPRALAAKAEATAAIAAVAVDGKVPGMVAGRFLALLPIELGRVGFVLLSGREVEMRLSERPDLLSGCQRDAQRDACLLAQAQFLGVSRLILPRLQPVAGGVGIALALFESTPAFPPQAARIERIAEVVELCRPCQNADLQSATERAAKALRKGFLRELEAELEIETSPPGARVFVDGLAVGRGPVAIALSPGDHVVVAEGEGANSEQRVTLAPKERQRVSLIVSAPPPPLQKKALRPLLIAKWALLSGGLAALLIGTTLWALDGQPSCSLAPGQARCPEVLDSAGAGIGLFAVGAVSLGASAILFGIDHRRGREAPQPLLSLGGRF